MRMKAPKIAPPHRPRRTPPRQWSCSKPAAKPPMIPISWRTRNTAPEEPSRAPHKKPNPAGKTTVSTIRTGSGHSRRRGGGKLLERGTGRRLFGASQRGEHGPLRPREVVRVELGIDREGRRAVAVERRGDELGVAGEVARVPVDGAAAGRVLEDPETGEVAPGPDRLRVAADETQLLVLCRLPEELARGIRADEA